MKNILSCILLFLPAMLPAQKIEPPPTKISLPSDTTQVPGKATEKSGTNLTLPDVVIFGEDKSARYAGNKKNTTPQAPSILLPAESYFPTSPGFSAPQKPVLKAAKTNIKPIGWAQGNGGSYSTLAADAGIAYKFDNTQTRLNAWFDKSNGQYVNSDYMTGGVATGIGLFRNQVTRLQLDGRYLYHEIGLHGASLSNLSRSANHGEAKLEARFNLENHSYGQVGAQSGLIKLHSDTASTELRTGEEVWFQLYGNYTIPWQGIDWSIKSDYLQSRYKAKSDSLNGLSTSASIAFESFIPFSPRLSALAGIQYQQVESDSFARKSRVSPYARVNAALSDQVGFIASIESGYKTKRFADWWQQNKYVSFLVPYQPKEIDYAVRAEGSVNVLSSVKFHTAFSRIKLSKTFYWQRDSNIHYIQPKTVSDVKLTEIKIGFSADIAKRSYIELYYIDYSDHVDPISLSPAERHMPYRPEYRIPFRADLNLPYKFFISTTAQFVGKRRVALRQDIELDPFILVDTMLAKSFSRFSLTLSINNILDQKYQIWQGYAENGISLFGGLVVKL